MAIDAAGTAAAMPALPTRELLGAADVTRTITRIAHQIIEKTASGPEPTSWCSSGSPPAASVLARRLAAAIPEFDGAARAVGTLDLTLYRDDLRRRPARALGATECPRRRRRHGSSCSSTTCCSPGAPCGRAGRAGRARPPARGAARRARRPRPPRAADPRRLRRQEPADCARRADRRAARRDRRRATASSLQQPPAERTAASRLMRHLLSAAGPRRRDRDRAARHRRPAPAGACSDARSKLPTLRGRTVVTMFYEDSTRTRVSFEAAGKWL